MLFTVLVFNIICLELQISCTALDTCATIMAGVGVAGHREASLVGGDHSSLDPVPWSSAAGVCF